MYVVAQFERTLHNDFFTILVYFLTVLIISNMHFLFIRKTSSLNSIFLFFKVQTYKLYIFILQVIPLRNFNSKNINNLIKQRL